jgi:flavorubredoxin
MNSSPNMEKPVEISKDIYWVGSGEEALLRCNIYLRVFNGKGKQYAFLIDPGPPANLAVLARKVQQVIGGLNRIDFLFINHQDPDVAFNAAAVQKLNPRVLALMTEDTWRLVQFYGLNQNRFRAVEKYAQMKAAIPSGQILQFIATPFCHFRGACMYYDVERRILFSGDLFGGISASCLFGEASHWEGVKAFHQLYMPSSAALRHAVRQIRDLYPPPLMIAPQHGVIIKDDVMNLFMSRLEELPVGMDMIQETGTKQKLIIAAANEIAAATKKLLGESKIREIIALTQSDKSYPSLFTMGSGNVIRDIKYDPGEAVEAFVQVIFSMCNKSQYIYLKRIFQHILLRKALPLVNALKDRSLPAPNPA